MAPRDMAADAVPAEERRPAAEVGAAAEAETGVVVARATADSYAEHGSTIKGRWASRARRWAPVALRVLAAAVGGVALWASLVAAVGAPFLPGGRAFSAVALAAVGAALGAGARACRTPSLVGPLVAGVLLRSTGVVTPDAEWQFAAAIGRKCALAVILLRAGLRLDWGDLRRLSFTLVRMTATPSMVEVVSLAAATRLLLDLPWLWGFMAGAMMAAVSPAVVIPALFRLQEKGFGTDKGIPTLVVAAASFDDVIAVTSFGVIHSIVFAQGDDMWSGVQRGLLAVPMGLAFGVLWGLTTRLLPTSADAQAVGLRSLLLLGGALLGVMGSEALGYGAAGPLAAIIASFVAAHGWRAAKWKGRLRVEGHFRTAWAAFEVVLFSLIGVEVDVRALAPMDVALCGGALTMALAVRIAATVIVAFGGGFQWKEKLFLAFSWLPKATVQAALGPAALDTARRLHLGEEAEARARWLLTLAALAILLTAPLGAALLHYTGPRLLRRGAPRASVCASSCASAPRTARPSVAQGPESKGQDNAAFAEEGMPSADCHDGTTSALPQCNGFTHEDDISNKTNAENQIPPATNSTRSLSKYRPSAAQKQKKTFTPIDEEEASQSSHL